MKLTEFTMPEVEYFRRECNFTPEERAVFDLHRRLNSIKCKMLRVL